MLNNIKISQRAEEIVLNINIIAEMHEIIEELETKIPKLKDRKCKPSLSRVT